MQSIELQGKPTHVELPKTKVYVFMHTICLQYSDSPTKSSVVDLTAAEDDHAVVVVERDMWLPVRFYINSLKQLMHNPIYTQQEKCESCKKVSKKMCSR